MTGSSSYDPRPDLAILLAKIQPLWEAHRLNGAEDAYERLLNELGHARLLAMGEWHAAVHDVFPMPVSPPQDGEAIARRARHRVYESAAQFASSEEAKARQKQYESEDDGSSYAQFFQGQASAWGIARAYLESGLRESDKERER